MQFIKTTNTKKIHPNSVIIGSPERNQLTKSLIKKGKLILMGVEEEEGYKIVTKTIYGKGL